MEFIEIKDGANLDANEMAVLESMDSAFAKTQKQLDDIYAKMETSRPAGKVANSIERKEATEWVKKFFKGKIDEKNFDPFMNTGSVSFDPTEGGYLVPEILMAEIAHWTYEYGVCRREMRYLPFGGAGNTRKLPTEATGVSVNWVDEAGAKPLTSISFGLVTQELKKLAAISVITEELIEDSAIDLIGFVGRRIGEAIAAEEDRVFLGGDINGAGDPFNGVMFQNGINALYMGAGLLPSDINADMLLEMTYEVPTPARSGASFIMHPGLMYYLQKLRVDVLAPGDGLGGYLVTQPLQGQPARMWGYSIILSDAMPAPDQVLDGDPFLIFANLNKTCVYGDKNGLRVKLLTEATLVDADGYSMSLAQSDAVAVRVHKRTGYACTLPDGIGVLIAGEDSGSGSGSELN